MKQFISALLILFATTSATAQDLQEIMRRAMEKQQGQQPPDGGEVTIEENDEPFKPLDFTGSYRMEIHSLKNGKEEKNSPAQMRMYFNSDHMAMIPENPDQKGNMRMVFDLRNKHTYTLITDEKGRKSGMKMKMMKVNVEGDGKDKEAGDIVRTSETKTIEGQTCHKYTYTDKDGHGDAWIAEDLSFDMMSAFKQMLGGKRAESWQNTPHKGVVMENNWNSSDGKETVTMHTRELVVGKVDESAFSTSGFEVTDMTAMPMFGK